MPACPAPDRIRCGDFFNLRERSPYAEQSGRRFFSASIGAFMDALFRLAWWILCEAIVCGAEPGTARPSGKS